MRPELGRIYVTRNGYKALAYQEADVSPPWWVMRDERGFSWLAKVDGRALSDKSEHPLDLVERTNLTMRNARLPERKGPAPEWSVKEPKC